MKCELVNLNLLVRAMDEELSTAELEWVPAHIAQCADCQSEREALGLLSADVQSAVNHVPVLEQIGDRQQLAALNPAKQTPARVMRRFGWGMGIAAALAIGIIMVPKHKVDGVDESVSTQSAAVSNAIEVDGETFVALPYSNPDLPSVSPRIVQMQVPVSSLADIGLGLGHVASELSNQDRTVLADVLMGADGQPLGVHVVSWE